MHAYAMELAKGNQNGLFGQWSVQTVRMVDGTEVPLLRALKDNAEYRLNIDFSTVCKKRMVMDALMNDLIRRGWLQHESLSPQDVARINQIIQQHGLEIACGICFVDSRRYNATKFAEGFLNKFNPIVESLGAEAPAGFNYSGNMAFSNEGKRDYSAVRESVDWSRVLSPEGINEAEMAKYELDWHAVAGILEPLRVRAARYMRGKKAVEKVDSAGKKLKDKDGNPEVVEVDCNFDAEFDAARRKQYDAELARMIQADRRAKGLPAAKSDIKAAEYEAAWMEYRKQLPEPSASERWNFAWAKMMNGGNAQQKMAMAISQSPELRKVAKVEDFIASEGWENVRQQNTGLERLWNIQKGAAGAKPNERFAPYQNDVLQKKLPNADIYDIGGYRMQSFSDFVGRMYFDYLQAFADLAAMQLPGHAYTKEPNFVKLFGMMGMKINMSLVCDVDKDVVNELGKDFAGLTRDADGNLTYNVAETLRDADGEIIKQGQTFPAEEAFALQADPRFSRNAGTIMVGLSREHILMALRDPRIRMVIPYHKSGLPHGVAMILNLSEINDYEPVQSTRRRDGKKMTAADRNAVDNYNFILHQLSIAKDRELAYNALRYIMVDHKMTGEIHEEYNKALRRVKADRAKNPDSYRRIDISERERDDTFIAKVAADIYLDACDAHGYIPRFDEFRGEHGYYKTLVDFSVYDHEGNYAPQEAVRFRLPEGVDGYIRESLEHDEAINAKATSENEGLIADIVTYLGNRELRDRQDMAAEKKKDEDVLTTIYNVGDIRNVPEVVAVAPSGPEGSPSPDRGSRIADALGVPAERRYSLRTKPDPKKTIKVYKLMRLGADGKLYPLFIDSAAPIELRRWYDGDAPDFNMLKKLPSGIHLLNAQTGEYVMDYDAFFNEHKEMFNGGKKGANPSVAAINWATENGYRFINIKGTERAQKRYGGENRQYYNFGINGSGSVSEYAMRPGWHAGTHPTMRQIGKGKNRDLRDDSFVWVEGEIAADNDYNAEAQGNPDKDLPGKMPVDGYYLKATNADKKKSQADRMGWYVSGAFRANRIISDAEARGVIDEWNAAHPEKPIDYDYMREGGKEFTEEDARRVNGANGVDSPAADRRYSLANEQRRDIALAMERATGHSVRFGRPPRGAAGFDEAEYLIVDPDRCASAAAVESAVGHVLADALPLPTLTSPELYNSTMDNIWRNLPEAVREGYAGRGTNDAERVVQYLADVVQDKSGAGRRAWNAAINGFRSAVRRQRGIRLETGDIELSLLEHLASANSSPLLKAEAVRARRDWEVADELAGRDASLEDEVVTVSTSDGGRRRFVALSEIDALRASITEAKEEELEANVRAVERYLRDRLSPEIATRFGKRKILELADRLKDGAVSKKGLQNVLMQAEMAIGESELRAAMGGLRKTLKTPTMRINSRQEREANRVDADTAAFFGALRDNLQEVLRKTYSDDEVELRSTIKDLNARIDSGVLSEEELAAAREELKTANRELDAAREERKRVEASRAHDSFVAVEDS